MEQRQNHGNVIQVFSCSYVLNNIYTNKKYEHYLNFLSVLFVSKFAAVIYSIHSWLFVKCLRHLICIHCRTVGISLLKKVLDILYLFSVLVKQSVKIPRTESVGPFPSYSFCLSKFLVRKCLRPRFLQI